MTAPKGVRRLPKRHPEGPERFLVPSHSHLSVEVYRFRWSGDKRTQLRCGSCWRLTSHGQVYLTRCHHTSQVREFLRTERTNQPTPETTTP